MSIEHTLPGWLSRAGSPAGNYSLMREGLPPITSRDMEIVTKRICEDCNTGWLARIEDTAAPVFKRLLGQPARIHQIDRWIIARWFSKTILTVQLAMTDRSGIGPLHPQDYRNFFQNARPFDNQFTFLCGYQGPLPPIQFALRSPDGATNLGVRAWFNFHHIVLMAAFMKVEGPATLRIPTALDKAAHIIWPTQRGLLWSGDPTLPLDWPPEQFIDSSGLEIVRDTFIGD